MTRKDYSIPIRLHYFIYLFQAGQHTRLFDSPSIELLSLAGLHTGREVVDNSLCEDKAEKLVVVYGQAVEGYC